MIETFIEFTFIEATILPLETTVPMFLATPKVSNKLWVIEQPCLHSHSVLEIVSPLTLVSVSLLVEHYTESLSFVSEPLALESITLCVYETAVTTLLAKCPFTLVDWPILISHNSLSMSYEGSFSVDDEITSIEVPLWIYINKGMVVSRISWSVARCCDIFIVIKTILSRGWYRKFRKYLSINYDLMSHYQK